MKVSLTLDHDTLEATCSPGSLLWDFLSLHLDSVPEMVTTSGGDLLATALTLTHRVQGEHLRRFVGEVDEVPNLLCAELLLENSHSG